MRIAIVGINHIPSRKANTIQVMKMAQAFVEQGHETKLIVPGRTRQLNENEEVGGDWGDLSHFYGLTHEFDISDIPHNPSFRKYDYGLKSVNAVKKWGADLLYTRLPQAGAVSSLSGFPTIFEVHDLPSGQFGNLLFKLILRGKGLKRLVIITEALAKELVKRYSINPDIITIAPDGVDLDRYDDLPDSQKARKLVNQRLVDLKIPFRLQEGTFTAGYTGHLYKGRGINLILDLANQLPEIQFLIVGGARSDLARIRQQLSQLQLKNLVLTGFIPNQELPLFQSACDILMMPYQREISASSGGDIASYLSPMKLFEYLATGRIIISSDLPVLREILNPANSVLIDPDNIEEWKETLKEIAGDTNKYTKMTENAKQTAKEHTWNNRVRNILKPMVN